MSMPSGTYDSLTLGSSGTQYTATASGYFVFSLALSENAYFAIFSDDSSAGADLLDIAIASRQQNYVCRIPVLSGNQIRIQYGGDSVAANAVRFYYAEGSKSLHVS